MRVPACIDLGGRPAASIHIGGLFASREPWVIRTILGSCVAVGLRDPFLQIGGLNHFMLPQRLSDGGNPSSYGIHAMEMLINMLMELGASRDRLEAKVFGGGHVLKVDTNHTNVAHKNITFALKFLKEEHIPVIKRDTGGYAGRELYFFTDTGQAMLRRMEETGVERKEIAVFEHDAFRELKASKRDKNVTLFD